MARVLGIEIAGDYNSAAIKEATAGVETFGRTVNEAATKNIERLAAQRVKLQELAGEYRALAASAQTGSAEQVAALDLAAKAQARLGVEALTTGTKVKAASKEMAVAEGELAKFTRGAAKASGSFGQLGLGLALGSGGFIAGAVATGGIKKSIDDAKALMDAQEQLSVAARNVGASLDPKQLDDYLKAESKVSLFTKTDLTASLVGLVRATGSVAKAQQDASLAANIARATGSDLATVTQGLINLEGGRTRSLVALGVKIPIVKTATDALTASGLKFTGQQRAEAAALDRAATAAEGKRILLERYHGSAEKYANSDAAATAKLAQAENELSASIGTVLLPVVKTIADPFAKWAQKEAESGDAAKRTKEIVGDLTTVLRDAKKVVQGIDDVTGSFKDTLKLLIGIRILTWTAGFATGIKGLIGVGAAEGAAGAGLLGAEAAAGGLLGKLTALGELGPLAIPITLVITSKDVRNTGKKFLDEVLHGNFTGAAKADLNFTDSVLRKIFDPFGLQGSPSHGSSGAGGGGSVNGLVGAPGGGITGLIAGASAKSAGASAGRAKLLQLAASAIGTPYLWGGNGPGGFDCSGLVQWAFANGLNVSIPRTTYGQAATGSLVGSNSLKGAKPGDVIFTNYGEGGKAGPGHEGLYLGNGKVLSAPHTGANVGITSLAGFTGGANYTVRDLLTKTRGLISNSNPNDSQAAAIAALIAHGTKKPVTLHGSGLIDGALLDKITGEKNSATDSTGSVAAMWLHREKADLERARADVAAKLKGASPKQKTAIEGELRTIDTQIAGVNKSITTNLKEQANAIKANAKAAISTAKSNISSAFGQIITDAQSAFSQETQDYIDNVLSAKYLQGTDTHGQGLQTASEKKLADMQAQDTASQLQDALTAAKQQLTDDTTGALLEHVVDITTGATRDIFGPQGTSQQKSLDQKAIDAAQRALDENTIAIDAAKERAQEDYDYAQAVKTYQQQRSLAESAMVRSLNALEKNVEDGKASFTDLQGVLAGFGVSISDIPTDQWTTDFANLGTAVQDLAKVMADEAAALAKIGDGRDAAAAQAAADSISWGTPITAGQQSVVSGLGGAGGYFLLNPIPHAAKGADVLSSGIAMIHKGEQVVPAADVAAYSGGGGGVTIHVNAPNYVGSHAELAAVLKSPALIEAVATAVLVGNRRGHIRASQLT